MSRHHATVRPVPRRVRLVVLGCVLLAACAAPSPGAPNEPAAAAAELTPAPTPRPSPRGTPTARATPSPRPTPRPLQTPAPEPGTLALETLSCEGGVVLQWSPSADAGFHHYTALRSPEREIPPHYPPIAPAVDWGGTYATDRFLISAVDASIEPSDTRWNYRVMSYDADGRVLESSSVVTAQLLPVAELAPVRAEAAGRRTTRLEWGAYTGSAACFTEYRILYGSGDQPATLLATVSDQETSSLETDALLPRTTHALRVEAIRATALGSFVVGRSEVSSYTPERPTSTGALRVHRT